MKSPYLTNGWTHPAQLLILQSQDASALCEQLHFDQGQRVSCSEVPLSPPPERQSSS